jgi:hypothetical protein
VQTAKRFDQAPILLAPQARGDAKIPCKNAKSAAKMLNPFETGIFFINHH